MQKFSVQEIPIIEKADDEFVEGFYEKRTPVVLRGIYIGDCTKKWTTDYLANTIGSQDVKIHVCNSSLMDFITKNFLYRTLPFNEFIKRASEFEHDEYFISNKELYYLRSLGKNARKDVADINEQFPVLSNDVIFPKSIPKEKIFSSVLRISSGGITLWTHYDIMDNMLIQIKGKKRAVLFPPEDALKLYLNGDKSEVLDIDNPDLNKYPDFIKVRRYEVLLEAGDILFIPALWFHNMKALEFSIAVNIFWKNVDEVLYDKKDPYGNKDLLPAQNAFTLLNKALSSLDALPTTYRNFYKAVLIAQIQKSMQNNCTKNLE